MATATLKENFEFVKNNFSALLSIYRYKHVLVHDKKVFGSFDTFAKAAQEGVKTYGIKGDFLVEFISDLPNNNFIACSTI